MLTGEDLDERAKRKNECEIKKEIYEKEHKDMQAGECVYDTD
jgi:hypothetical protein